MEIKCNNCEKFFTTKDKNRKYCSQKCFRLWRRNKTYEDMYGDRANEIKQKIGKTNKEGKTYLKGKLFEKGHKFGFTKGFNPWNKDKKGVQNAWNKGLVMKSYYDEEQYKKFIEGCIKGGIKCCLKMSSRNDRTIIELKIEEVLKEIGVKFLSQYPMLGIAVVDFYLPDNHLIIEADGDYWHNYPYGTVKDHTRDRELKNANYKILRFWETDIHKDIEGVKKKILRELQRL